MDVLAVRESALVSTLLLSIPAVFEREGSPSDMNFILSYLKQAVCYRGITTSTQKLLVQLLVPLSSFKGGLIDHKELEEKVVWEVPSSLDIQLDRAGVEKLTGVEELKELAVKLCDYSKQERLKRSSSSSVTTTATPTSESEEDGNVCIDQAKRILYNRDQLLSLKSLGNSSVDNLDVKLPKYFRAMKDASHNCSLNKTPPSPRIPPSSQCIVDLSAIFPLSSQQRKLPTSPQCATTSKFPSPCPFPTSCLFSPPVLSLTANCRLSSSNGTSSGSPHTIPLHKTTNFPCTSPSSPLPPVSSRTTPSPLTPSPLTPVSSRSTPSPLTPVSSRTTSSPLTPVSSRSTPSPLTPVSSRTTSSPLTPVSSRSTPSPLTPVSLRTTPSPHTLLRPPAGVSSSYSSRC